MENNKVCSNCGTNNKSDSNFCENCGKQLIQGNTVANVQDNIQHNISNDYMVKNQTNNIEDSKGNKLGIISLVLYFVGSALISLISFLLPSEIIDNFSVLDGLCSLSGIVVMIFGRIKYPTNKFLKIVMWIIIGSIIFGLILFILFVLWCYVTCSNFNGCC